jgi:periplasmic protein TonB
MNNNMPSSSDPVSTFRRQGLLAALAAAAAALVAACKSAPGPGGEVSPGNPESAVIGPVPASKGSARASAAATPRAYRKDGATHLYGLNSDRIYKGRLPPQLYAVGVMNVEIDRVGRVSRFDWLRAPRHAPEVMAEIEKMVRSASPFPAPERLGKVTYTDTWLWHKTGQFQLDTLTEGQD